MPLLRRRHPSSATREDSRMAAELCPAGGTFSRGLGWRRACLGGWCPVSAGLLTEGGQSGVYGGEEVLGVQGPDQLVALEFRTNGILELGEHERGAVGVELFVEVSEHVGRGGVDVGDRLGGDEDPLRPRVS